jgi:CRP/FNR family transcriptional regulator, cyclic AMP receptor protein
MTSLIPDFATLERRLAGLPRGEVSSPEVVLTAGSKTGGLLFLRSGTVEVVKDGVQIERECTRLGVRRTGRPPGPASYGRHVRTLEQSEFSVADAPAILAGDPTVALYVAAILARRLDAANRWLVGVSASSKLASLPA